MTAPRDACNQIHILLENQGVVCSELIHLRRVFLRAADSRVSAPVGKSTLFNALLQKASAEAANFPFCTIEPNTGIVSVPDERLDVCESHSRLKTLPLNPEPPKSEIRTAELCAPNKLKNVPATPQPCVLWWQR